MSSCHHCVDIVSKLNEEYDILYKQLEFADNIIKKNNYKYCLSLIPKTRNFLKELYDECDPCDREYYEFNPNNFLDMIKQIGRTEPEDEFGLLIKFLNED